jgi:hypothetical protein
VRLRPTSATIPSRSTCCRLPWRHEPRSQMLPPLSNPPWMPHSRPAAKIYTCTAALRHVWPSSLRFTKSRIERLRLIQPRARMHRRASIRRTRLLQTHAPGNGDLLRRGWETFTKEPGAVRKHWSLLSKDERYEIVFADDEKRVLGEMASVIHAFVSIASHPRMRVGSRDVEFTEGGGALLSPRSADPDMARRIAALASIVATSALQHRRTWSRRPPNECLH